MLTVFIGLILGKRRLRTEEPPPAWATASGAPQRAPLGHTEEQPLRSPSTAPTATRLFTGSPRKQETRGCKGIKISLGMSLRPQERGPPTLTRGLLESETEPRELSAEFVFPCPSWMGFLSLPLRWVFFAFRLHRGRYRELGSGFAWPPPCGAAPGLFQPGYFEPGHLRCQAP